MSLLTEASLIVTPNAYKAGTLYSVIPNTTLGDMTVVRATSATRVNSAGLIEIARTNLLLQSQTFEDASWSKSFVTVTANTTTSPDGTTTADTITGIGALGARLIQSNSISFTASTSYSLSVFAKKGTNDFIQLFMTLGIGGMYANFNLNTGVVGTLGTVTGNAPTSSITNFGNGWYRCTINFTATTTTSTITSINIITSASAARAESNTLTTSVFLWGAQLEIGSVATEYIPTVASIRTKFAGITQDGSSASNIPRIDYPPLGGCPSILVEPQRTNLALYSEEFDNATWTTNGLNATVSANVTTSPDGTSSADAILTTITNGLHYIQQRTGSAIAGTTYTMSVYVKYLGYDYCQLQTSNTGSAIVVFRFSTKTVTLSGAQVVANSGIVTEMANGWFRIQVSVLPLSSAGWRWWVVCLNDSAQDSFIGDVTKGLYVWGFQFEVGTNATSYIPTVASSVTRNTDSFTLNNIYTNGLLSASGGTWFVELINNIPLTRDANSVGLNLDVSLGNNGFAIRNNAAAQRLTISKYISNVRSDIYLTTTNTCKIVIKWNGTTADIFENGTKVVSATSFTPTAMQVINGSSTDVSKNINQMSLWATPLTDDQCILLTGPSFSSYPEMASALIYTLQ